MKKLPILILALVIFSSFTTSENKNTTAINFVAANVANQKSSPTPAEIASMKVKDVEKMIGRKLTLKEKLSLKIAQYKIKKGLKAKAEGKSSKGQTAMILGIIGIACILIPYGIIASIPLGILAIVLGSQAKRENKNDSKAQTGIILGIVTLGLVALAIIVVAIWLASWGW